MAMDYLPIQATSVPCERVFSSAKETDSARRNRISPVLMEALQLLKFSLKKERLHFMKGWATSEAEMVGTVSGRLDYKNLNSLVMADDPDTVLDEILNDITADDRK